MITFRPAIAALAAVALLFSTASIGANRAAAVAAKNAAKSGSGARLGASLAVLQKAAERRVPQQTVTRNVKHKLPALRASQGYVSLSAYGDDLAGLRAQLEAKGLKDAVVHATAVSGKAPVAALRDMAETQRPEIPAAHAGDGAQPGDPWFRRAIARCARTLRGVKAAPPAGESASACCPTATTARRARSSLARRSRAPRRTSPTATCRVMSSFSRILPPRRATIARTKGAR